MTGIQEEAVISRHIRCDIFLQVGEILRPFFLNIEHNQTSTKTVKFLTYFSCGVLHVIEIFAI